jgi:hypothetical protein
MKISKIIADKLADLREVDIHNSNLVSGYRNDDFVGVESIAPIVPTPKEAGVYPIWSPSPYIPIEKLRVSMGSKRVRIDMSTTKGAYAIARYEVEVPIYGWELKEIVEQNHDTFVEKKTLRGEDVVQLGMEVAISTALQDPTSYDSSVVDVVTTSTQQFMDTINCDPIARMRYAINVAARKLNVRKERLAVAFGPLTWEAFCDHPKVLGRAVGQTGNEPSTGRIKEILQVGEINLLSGTYAVTIDEINPDEMVTADLWGDVVLIYLPVRKPNPGDPLPAAIARLEEVPYVDEYADKTVAGDALIKVTHDAWGLVRGSNKRIYMIKNASGKTL